jgi:phenylacetate-CoA ligase
MAMDPRTPLDGPDPWLDGPGEAGFAWPLLPTLPGALVLSQALLAEAWEWWPREQLEAHQRLQLEVLLAHARAQVPFYRERDQGRDSPRPLTAQAWNRVPVLDRSTAAAAGLALRAACVPPDHGPRRPPSRIDGRLTTLSLESTGLVDLRAAGIEWREHAWRGRDPGATWAVIDDVGAPVPEPDWGPPVALVVRTGPRVRLPAGAPAGDLAGWLRDHEPRYLAAPAALLPDLLEACRDGAGGGWRPAEVRIVGGPIPDGLAAAIESGWGAETSWALTSPEVGVVALPCPEVPGNLHVQSDHLRVEILDAAGVPCREGEEGRLVLTSLHNFASPLLRYAPGSRATPGPQCPCGRGLPVIRAPCEEPEMVHGA